MELNHFEASIVEEMEQTNVEVIILISITIKRINTFTNSRNMEFNPIEYFQFRIGLGLLLFAIEKGIFNNQNMNVTVTI